jgi:hypothetical protein
MKLLDHFLDGMMHVRWCSPASVTSNYVSTAVNDELLEVPLDTIQKPVLTLILQEVIYRTCVSSVHLHLIHHGERDVISEGGELHD